MQIIKILLGVLAGCLLFTCCTQMVIPKEVSSDWHCILEKKLPLLGHRNWIVVTDMAYPLQSNSGILTLYAEEPYRKVLKHIQQSLEKVPHVYAHVYQDQELSLLKENLCPEINAFRQDIELILADEKITAVPHEQLIARLDSASRMFQVIIIKTNLTIPYTSTFFELDCKYWDSKKQKMLTE